MSPYGKISKINELKEELRLELLKEDKDLFKIQKIQGQIFQLGLTLTARDITTIKHG